MVRARPAPPQSLGVFDGWGAFRDADGGRCWAIAAPARRGGAARDGVSLTVGSWPGAGRRGEVSVRASVALDPKAAATLTVGGVSARLRVAGRRAWSVGPRADAALVGAMRAADGATLTARSLDGRAVVDRYPLRGAASAIDAATLGCARGG